MKFQLKNKNLNLKYSIILFSIVYYYFFLSICFGYLSSKIFFNFVNEINKTDLSKSIQFRKKFSFKNITKLIIDFFGSLLRIGLYALVRNFCC